ncbi:MAG: hypothetical protein ACJ74J_20540 [Blastocatellia bacterium]
MKEATLKRALDVMVQFYEAYKDAPFTALPPQELRALAITAEGLDVFQKFDAFIGCETDQRYAHNQIYSWAKSGAEHLHSSLGLKEPFAGRDPLLVLYQIRLVAAVHLNEQYRYNDYSYGPNAPLGQLIAFAEDCLRPQLESDFSSFTAYRDVMVNLHFLHGKSARQAGEYVEAERSFYRSLSYLLELTLNYSAGLKYQPPSLDPPDQQLTQICSKMRRIGVVDLALAWLYLAWGKIDQANLYVERAIQLLGPRDSLSRLLAESIQGTILRLRHGHIPQKLDQAISLLSKTYRSFLSGTIRVPRHSMRTLYELEIALILKGDLKQAFKKIQEMVNRILSIKAGDKERYWRGLRKLIQDSRWQLQMHILCSRIARKDEGDTLNLELDHLYETLSKSPFNMQTPQHHPASEQMSRHSWALAIKFAEAARNIAHQNNLRIYKMDSLIALGEAYFFSGRYNRGNYERARKTFKSCLELVKAPYGASGEKGIDGSDLSAVSHLYLARIAVKMNERDEAQEALKRYEQLPTVEHSWILKRAEETRREVQELLDRRLIIDLDESVHWPELEEKFEGLAAKKLIIEPSENKLKTNEELIGDLKISRKKFYKLKDKYGNHKRIKKPANPAKAGD